MKTLLITTAAIAAAFAFAAPTAATTYIGTRHVGAATAQLSITTDGTLGVLAFGNITDYTIGLSDPGHSTTLFGPLSGNNSGFVVLGSALSATATQLLFDFGGPGGAGFGDTHSQYCITGNGFNCFPSGEFTEQIFFFTPPASEVTYDNLQVLGTAVPGGVPEPASWALMMAGFGLTGAAMRRRGARLTYSAAA